MIFPDIFYLGFSNFYIKLVFAKTEKNGLKQVYKKNIYNFYRPFITINPPKKIDCLISFKDLVKIPQLSQKNKDYIVYVYKKNNKNFVTYYHISLPQFQLIIDKILTSLNKDNYFRLHASASIYKSQAFVFLAPSGGGKSTIVKLLKPKYTPFADDSLSILKERGSYFCIKSPSLEKNPYNSEIKKYPIGAIFFLKKDHQFSIKLLTNEIEVLSLLSKQVWIKDKEVVNKFMNNYLNFFEKNRFFLLSFAKESKKLTNFFEKNQQFFS